MTNARPLSGLGVILAITLATTGAHAQQYRPDAEGYPCTARDRLTIIQDDQGYSIRSQPVAAQVTKEASATGIAIGNPTLSIATYIRSDLPVTYTDNEIVVPVEKVRVIGGVIRKFRGNLRIRYAIDNGRFWLTALQEENFNAEIR